MSDRTGTSDSSAANRWRGWHRPAAFAAAGVLAGGILAGTLSASANSSDNTSSASRDGRHGSGRMDESKSQRPDETLLTGDSANRVRAAALAEYPGATIERVETDSDGVYEAHLVTTGGERVTVEVGEDFAVSGTESAPGGGHPPRPADDTEAESS
ncbi:MAG: PepSY domain-containing protein [Actinomycetes bacterium]